jgi:type VI secretion system protein
MRARLFWSAHVASGYDFPRMTLPQRVTRALPLLAAAALAVAACGCGGAPARIRLMLEVSTTPRANQNSPVAVSFVAVRDQKFFEKTVTLTAKQWFDQREQLHRDDPSGQLFTEWEWEYVPGHPPPPSVIEIDGASVAALIFANYRTPGDHRIRLGPQRKLRIELGDEDVTVRPLDEQKP